MNAARDDRTGGEARKNERSRDGEESENFNGHGVHLFVSGRLKPVR
jgi:hypothetical protein